MTTAVCLRCGSLKFGALNTCNNCGFTPSTDDEIIRSTAMTDHYFATDILSQMGRRIASGLPVELDQASYETLRKGLAEVRKGSKDKRAGLFPRLFGAARQTTGSLQDSRPKITWTIVTEHIESRLFRLKGVQRSIDVPEMTLVSVVIGSKIHGWKGGNEFFEMHGSQGVLRRLTSDMVVLAEDAKDLGITFYDFVQKETDADAGLRKGTFAEDFLKLCLEGGFRIIELSPQGRAGRP